MRWVGTWTTSPAPLEEVALEAATLRMIARVSIGGARLRVRFSSAHGTRALAIADVTVALRDRGPGVLEASVRKLTFGGSPACRIAAGALALSDPIDLLLPPLSDLAVTFRLLQPVSSAATGVTGHKTARQTSYIAPSGDFAHAATTESWYFLSAIEVEAPAGTLGLVAFGDSLTDGNISTPDNNNRWPDQLARRLAAREAGPLVGIMNQGIGGNRLLHDMTGDSGLRRFDRDVLAQPGGTHVLILLGVNDLRNRRESPAEIVAAADMIAGLKQLAARARAAGLGVYGGTLLPYENETFYPGGWTRQKEEKRLAVNAWIRSGGAFDAVIDFDAALRDPACPSRLLPAYDCGDHLHPSDAGYRRMGDIIDLALLA